MPGCDKCRGLKPRVAVIGAGASGLAATKALLAHGIDAVTFEQNPQLGGLWRYDPATGSHSGAYHSLRARTRKSSMEFSDFAMPVDFPDFPTATQVAEYLESYAQHFSLTPHIRFSTRVVQATSEFEGTWMVTSQARDGQVTTECFSAVVVSNGAYWQPQMPDLQGVGQFTGRILHSHDYKEPAAFASRRVLIVGMGVSGVEISAELASAGVHVIASTSRPAAVTEATPRHSIELRPPVERFTSTGAVFMDGSSVTFDDLIFCTGYRASFPFLPRELEQKVTQGTSNVQLWKHMWVPELRNIAFLGFITTNGSIIPLVEAQSEWFASVMTGKVDLPPLAKMEDDMADWKELITQLNISYKPTEVTSRSYLAEIYNQLGLLADPRYKEYAKYL